MTDLTQFYGEQGLVIDKNFAFTSTSKSNGDLISEMRSNGLLVDFLDTTGNLVRVDQNRIETIKSDVVRFYQTDAYVRLIKHWLGIQEFDIPNNFCSSFELIRME